MRLAATLVVVTSAGVLAVPAAGASAASTTVASSAAVSPVSAAAVGLPSRAQMRAARLSLADLPSGYRRDRSSSSDTRSSSSDPACSRLLTAMDSDGAGDGQAVRSADSSFTRDRTFGPFVMNSIAAWRTTAGPRAALAVMRRLGRTCTRWTETDTDGTRSTIHLRRLPLGAFGDERVGMRMRVTAHGVIDVSVRADMAVVRVGRTVTLVAVMTAPAFSGPASVTLGGLTGVSVARLEQLR